MNTEIISTLERQTQELLNAIHKFTPDEFNTVPFEGSWTGGQCCEHISLSEKGMLNLLNGTTKLGNRQIDEKVPAIEAVFLNYNIKMENPDFNNPSAAPHDKHAIYQSLKQSREEVINGVKDLDLSLICTDFELPGMGEFTGYEWLWFMYCHATRHIRQLKNIYSKLEIA